MSSGAVTDVHSVALPGLEVLEAMVLPSLSLYTMVTMKLLATVNDCS